MLNCSNYYLSSTCGEYARRKIDVYMVRPTVDLHCHLAGNATADMDLSSEKENLKDGLWVLDHRHFVYVKCISFICKSDFCTYELYVCCTGIASQVPHSAEYCFWSVTTTYWVLFTFCQRTLAIKNSDKDNNVWFLQWCSSLKFWGGKKEL